MITAAAIALSSIPFALVVLAGPRNTGTCSRDAFVVAYAAALGLILSLIVLWDVHPPFPMPRLGIIEEGPAPKPAELDPDAEKSTSVVRTRHAGSIR